MGGGGGDFSISIKGIQGNTSSTYSDPYITSRSAQTMLTARLLVGIVEDLRGTADFGGCTRASENSD